MYIAKHFEETRVEVMHELIRARPLASLVTLSSGGLNANHIPLYLADSPARYDSLGSLGSLRGHVARANLMLEDLQEERESLAIFHGPDTYITPSWYPTKQETGKVVPTWNYAVVHAYGVLRVVDDAQWLRAQLEALTAHNEASFAQPWGVSDAPQEHVERLMGAIIGVEMVITRLLGKWKVSQNQPEKNKAGVVDGLRASSVPDAPAMAALVEAGAKTTR